MGFATESLYDKPSVLIGRKGTIGKVKYVDHPFWTVDTLFYTIVNTELVIPKYLYYLMSLIDLNNYNEGTTIPSLRTETLNRLEFAIPSLEEQEKILSFINPIDKKIKTNTLKELNRRINKYNKDIYLSFESDEKLNYALYKEDIQRGITDADDIEYLNIIVTIVRIIFIKLNNPVATLINKIGITMNR